jgi:hypothetical protein
MVIFYDLDWEVFQRMYLMNATIFVRETDASWIMYVSQNGCNVRCIVQKSKDDLIYNIQFVDKYLNRGNVIKIKRLIKLK